MSGRRSVPGDTKIEWSEATWNPVTGCSKVSPGCAHCYAETLTERYAGNPGWIEEHRPWTPENAEHNVRLRPERLDQPLRWKKPRMIFVNSMSDLFHELVPAEYIYEVFRVMGRARQHVFQVLTKRPERMFELLALRDDGVVREDQTPRNPYEWPLPNVWLGTSIENRRFVGRADYLRRTPAAVRFISAEPLLGPLVYDEHYQEPGTGAYVPCWSDTQPTGTPGTPPDMADDSRTVHPTPELDLDEIDWLIVGGESGPGARRMDLQWVRDLRDACRADGESGPPGATTSASWCKTAFFMKQLGGAKPGSKLEDLPEDLRIREFPR
jgi:protein gp37